MISRHRAIPVCAPDMLSSVAPDATWRRTNLGHLLFVATGLCIRDKLDIVRSAGFDGITDAQLSLFQHLNDQGSRLTTLAARAGIAKQSMIELVDKAERHRFVRRDPDPADRRAKIVRPTALGLRLRGASELGMQAAEERFGDLVGGPALATIKRALIGYLDAPAQGLERVLADAARRFVRDVLDAAHRRGHGAVTEAQLALFRHLDLGGSRLTDVAIAARVTKQSMRAVVERAEALRLVERSSDPADGRAKTIRFSRSGLLMLDDMRRGIGAAEARYAAMTGPAALASAKAVLSAYISAAS